MSAEQKDSPRSSCSSSPLPELSLLFSVFLLLLELQSFQIKEMKVRRKRIESETLVLNLVSCYIFPDATKALEADNMKKDSCG